MSQRTTIAERLAGLPARVRRRAARLVHERGRLEDTYGRVPLSDLGIDSPDSVHYEPSSWRHLDRALEGHEITGEDVFLDMGCGKGRVVQLAARRPFARVVGVELAPELLEVAQRNIDRTRRKLACGSVDLVVADVVDYEVPDDVTYVYLYNPFVGDIFRAALNNVIASLDRRPRPLTLIYANPTMADAVAESGRFTLEREFAMGDHAVVADAPVNERVAVYRGEPAA